MLHTHTAGPVPEMPVDEAGSGPCQVAGCGKMDNRDPDAHLIAYGHTPVYN